MKRMREEGCATAQCFVSGRQATRPSQDLQSKAAGATLATSSAIELAEFNFYTVMSLALSGHVRGRHA
jgi:hypothetical protein